MCSVLVEHDRKLNSRQGALAGMDEVGRGALAGPVVVGCIHGNQSFYDLDFVNSIDDSKTLSTPRRESLSTALQDNPDVHYGLGRASSDEIDQLGIVEATNLAGKRAYQSMNIPVDLILVDTGLSPSVPEEAREIESGDSQSLHIAAASIVAKVFRDDIMRDYAPRYPDYGWENNFGYGTSQHRQAIQDLGPSPLHRKSFRLT